MTYDDFLPLVLPSVNACPVQVAEQAIRLAAIEFCDRTHVWNEDLDTLLSDGLTSDFPLALDDQVELANLENVVVLEPGALRPIEFNVVNARQARRLLARNDPNPYAWTDDLRTLRLSITPAADAQVKVHVALKPSMASFDFPAHVFAHHAKHIATGALAQLLGMPKTDWTDQGAAGIKTAEFERHINRHARATERGNGVRDREPYEKYL